jgi:dienelactone hydrolase
MIHVIKLIEHRRGAADGGRRIAPRAALLSALTLSIGIGAACMGRAQAQDAPPQTQSEQAPSGPSPAAEDAQPQTEPAFDPVREALALLDRMEAGDFAAIHARFDAKMAAAVSAEQMSQGWTAVQTQIGASQGRGEPIADVRDDGALITIPLRYERGELKAFVAFDAERRVSGFAIRPAQTAARPAAPPPPEDANYAETELRIGDEAGGLPATLSMPKGDGTVAAVVLVHGSGPQDRDQTIGPNKPFLDIARGLAERGIAVLRYEKRTRARPQDFADGGTIDLETTEDALAAVALLRTQPRIDPKRVFVLGHSLGGMMAPRIGTRDTQIAGLILLAAPSRPLLDILIEQNRRMAVLNDGKTDDAESAEIAKLAARIAAVRRGEEVSGVDAPMGLPSGYWRSVEAVDPIAEARATKQPLLLLQGARDLQVVDADWQRWRSAFREDPQTTFKLYETLSHLAIPGEGTLQDYATPGHVAPELIADVAAWIAAQPGRKAR